MKTVIWCLSGAEQHGINEVEELIGKKATILRPGRLVIENTTEQETADLTVYGRTFLRTGEFLGQGNAKTIDEIKVEIQKLKLNITGTFAVRSERKGEQEFTSQELEREIGDKIGNIIQQKVDLENPDKAILIDMDNDSWILILDWCGKPLSKRDYRIQINNSAINPCFAAVLLREAGWTTKESLLDFFTRTGEVPIEAALKAINKSPFYESIENFAFQKFFSYKTKQKEKETTAEIFAVDSLQNNLRNAEINAKLAGVQKVVTFRRIEMDWMDIKFGEASVDVIITVPPAPSNQFPENKAKKLYKDVFYQVKYILKNKGRVIVAIPKKEAFVEEAIKEGFKVEKEIKVTSGNREYSVLTLKKAI